MAPTAFVIHAHHACCSHPDLDPGVSLMYAFFRSPSLAVGMPCVIQGDQNLFLFGKLVPQGSLLLAVAPKFATEPPSDMF